MPLTTVVRVLHSSFRNWTWPCNGLDFHGRDSQGGQLHRDVERRLFGHRLDRVVSRVQRLRDDQDHVGVDP